MTELHNIFSRRKNKESDACPNPKIPIIVDTREKQSLIAANLLNKKANIEFEKLDIGDYLIADTIIERKTFSDFVGSMINKRLSEQLSNMKKYEKCFLIVEGFCYNYDQFNVHENAIRGMFLSTAIDFGIPLIFTENEKDTADFLILTARKYEKGKVPIALRQAKNLKTLEEQKKFILEGFPGIGPKTAEELLKNFSSLKGIFNASEKTLSKISGMDENRIQKFRELLEN